MTNPDAVIDDVRKHGEVHAVFEGVEGEVELRKGTTSLRLPNMIVVDDGVTTHHFDIRNLVHYYKPMRAIDG